MTPFPVWNHCCCPGLRSPSALVPAGRPKQKRRPSKGALQTARATKEGFLVRIAVILQYRSAIRTRPPFPTRSLSLLELWYYRDILS